MPSADKTVVMLPGKACTTPQVLESSQMFSAALNLTQPGSDEQVDGAHAQNGQVLKL